MDQHETPARISPLCRAFSHGNTTGGWLPGEEFTAAVELLIATREPQYGGRVAALWPEVSKRFGFYAVTAVRALPPMPAPFRADFSFIAGGLVPGVLILEPDFPENSENWPFFWGENEYVVNMSQSYMALAMAAKDLPGEER